MKEGLYILYIYKPKQQQMKLSNKGRFQTLQQTLSIFQT